MEFKSKALAAVAGMAAVCANANAVHARLAADVAEVEPFVPRARVVNIAEARAAAAAKAARDRLAKKDLRYAAQLELIEEVRGLHADVHALRQIRVQMERLLSRWDGDGLPGPRE